MVQHKEEEWNINISVTVYHIHQMAAHVAKLVLTVHLGSPFGGREIIGVSDKSNGGFLHALHCDHCDISNHSATICHRISPMLKSSEVGHFGAKFRKEGVHKLNFSTIQDRRGCHMQKKLC